MKKYILTIMCLLGCLSNPLSADDDLIQLFHLAVENRDVKLVKEVVEALLKLDNNNKNLLDALAKYSEKGKIDFALHNAIKDKNLLASVVLAHHSKNVNTRKDQEFFTCVGARDAKTPIELSLEADLIGLIPYLLMKNANPYLMRTITYVYEDEEENLDYLVELGFTGKKQICAKTQQVFFHIPTYYNFQRNLISDAIVYDRLDVIEILEKTKIDWNKHCMLYGNINFTPLQLSLAAKRYEIAQFLIDHGARIE